MQARPNPKCPYKSIPDYKSFFKLGTREEMIEAIVRHCYYSKLQFEQTFGKANPHKK